MAYRSRSVMLVVLLGLAGCSGMSDTLGLGRNSPDEFAVVDRPPLSLPPDFSLRPPEPGAARPQAVNLPDKAEKTLFGGKDDKSVDTSESEASLLAKAGADKTEDNVRELIDQEASQKVVGNRHLLEELLWGDDSSGDAVVVDAVAEQERLKSVKEKGQATNSSATPIIEKNKSGWLGF